MSAKSDNLIWIDLEMTGLYPEKDRIIEIATIVTDSKLNTIAEGPVFAIKQSDELLSSMDSWNTKQHNGSGLATRVYSGLAKESKHLALDDIRESIEELKYYRSNLLKLD